MLGEGNGTPLQYSCLENPMDGGAWWAAVHGVTKSRTRLSDFTFTFHFHALEKEMEAHSSVLAWRIPGTRGAWWAAVYGVARSRTWLKRLSSSSSQQQGFRKDCGLWFLSNLTIMVTWDPALSAPDLISHTLFPLTHKHWHTGIFKMSEVLIFQNLNYNLIISLKK